MTDCEPDDKMGAVLAVIPQVILSAGIAPLTPVLSGPRQVGLLVLIVGDNPALVAPNDEGSGDIVCSVIRSSARRCS